MVATVVTTVLTAVIMMTGRCGSKSSELLKDFDPIDIGHEDVEKHEIDALGPDHADCRSSARDVLERIDFVEDQMESVTHAVVVDNEYNWAIVPTRGRL